LPKRHPFLGSTAYERVREVGAVGAGLSGVRQTARLLAEELPAAVALARVIRRTRADVVHLGNGLRANFDGLLASLFTGRPAVCHVKGFEKYGRRERWASGRVRSLVCMTRAILDYCREQGLRVDRARVVYDAVDGAWLRPRRPAAEVRTALGIDSRIPCVGIVGNVQEWKGQAVLIEALAQLAREGASPHVLIVGGVHKAGEEYDARLRRRVDELGLSGRVHFLGFREDVVDVMDALDVVVHASVRPEPFGRVILEGMLLGKPVIATRAGGVLELVDDGRTGFLVPPGDAGALAACLKRLLGDLPGARKVGDQARCWASEQFSLSRQVEEMLGIYENAVGGNARL